MSEYVLVSIVYLWFLILGVLIQRNVKKLKGVSNILILYTRYSFLVGVFFALLSFIPIGFSKYLIIIWFATVMFLLNFFQKRSTSKFDLLVIFLFSVVGVIDTIFPINLFFVIGVIYVVIYTIFYLLSDYNNDAKKILIVNSIVVILSSIAVSIILILGIKHEFQKNIITSLSIIISSLSSYMVLVLNFLRDVDEVNNRISVVLLEKESELKQLNFIISSVINKLKTYFSNVEMEVNKIEKNKIQELLKDISLAVSEISPIVDFIQKTTKDYEEKIENILKNLPNLSENLSNDITKLTNVKQSLSDTNTSIMSLVKVALDSEKSVMGVSKSIKELRETARLLTDNLKIFSEISEQSSILSINISVEASKLGSKGTVFSKLSQQAKKFADTISSSIESTKKLIKDLDNKAEFSDYMIKTLVMSFVEIETSLKNVSKNISSILEKFEVFSATSENIRKEVENITKMTFVIPEFSSEINRRVEDIILNYKKLKKYSEDIISSSVSLENTLKSILENMKSTIIFIDDITKSTP